MADPALAVPTDVRKGAVICIADGAHPQEVLLNVVAAARTELDVVDMGTGPSLADIAHLPEVVEPKALDRPRVHNARRRAWVRIGQGAARAVGTPVGQNTQEDAHLDHAATPVV